MPTLDYIKFSSAFFFIRTLDFEIFMLKKIYYFVSRENLG